MADRGRPSVDDPGDSPVPEGYGSLNEAAPGPAKPSRARRSGRAPEGRSMGPSRSEGLDANGSTALTSPPAIAPAGVPAPSTLSGSPDVERPIAARRPVPRTPVPTPAGAARVASDPGGQSTTVVARSGAPAPSSFAPADPSVIPAGLARGPNPSGWDEAGDSGEGDDGQQKRFRRRRKVRVVRSTSSRRLIRRVDTWTVFKVSFVFYLLTLAVLVASGIILWNVAEAFGTITSIQKSVRSLFALSKFVLKPVPLLEYFAAGGAVLCLLGTIVNTVVAVLYNLISDVVGGVQVIVVTEPD